MAEPTRIYKRGDIVLARFDPTEGSEQSGVRPAIILSPTNTNRRSPMLILAPLTTRNTERIYPHEALIAVGDGTPRPSKVLLNQIRSMSLNRVLSNYGPTSPQAMAKVDAALKIAVGFDPI